MDFNLTRKLWEKIRKQQLSIYNKWDDDEGCFPKGEMRTDMFILSGY